MKMKYSAIQSSLIRLFMDKMLKQIESLNAVVKKHGKYTHFSGFAAIIAGILWLVNEGTHWYLHFLPNYRVISWIVIVLIIILLTTFFTLYEGHKKGKEVVNLPLFAVVDKLSVVSITTLIIMYVFYKNGLIPHMPALLMAMYGVLIIASKLHLTLPIVIYGYVTLLAGLVGLVFWQYAVLISVFVLGVGHIALGIILLLRRNR